jgi:ribose 5-phosphate isomerase B
MTIYIGADHRGFSLKEELKPWLNAQGYSVTDCGNAKLDPNDDFPDFAFAVADSVVKDRGSLGIVICGSGGGVTIAANRVKGVRCAQGVSAVDVIHNRQHNDMNVLAIGSDITLIETAKIMVKSFLETPFGNSDRYIRRINKIKAREE